MMQLRFESLRSELENLIVPHGEVRILRWLAGPLGIARTATGDFEVFIRGPEIQSSTPLVRRHLQHGLWRPQSGGDPFAASRVMLPSAPYFASIAALIAIELVRAGIAGTRGAQAAFSEVEPIIEMAIRRGALPDSVIVGLIGELLLLRHLITLRTDQASALMRCVDLWHGWQEGGRDFRIGDHSIEVKTTQASSSIHQFSGLHQLESKTLPSGASEKLHLVSIGVAASTSMGESLPSLVESMVSLLVTATGGDEVANELVRRVALYGSGGGSGYVHEEMADWSAYATRYALTFAPRLYHLNDPAMRLLTRDLLSQTYVQPDSVSFTMHLPDVVSAFNPAPDWGSELAIMLPT